MPEKLSFKDRLRVESFLRLGEDAIMGKVEFDQDKCKGCNLCVLACPAAAIELIDKKAKMIDKDPECIACGNCASICSEDVITVTTFTEFKKIFRYLDRGKPEWPRIF